MNINIIGTGKLGTSLSCLIQLLDGFNIQGIVNRTYEKSLHTQKIINAGVIYTCIEHLPPADITLIGVNDDQIESVVQQIYQTNPPQPGHILFHCSGLLSSELLRHPDYAEVYCASIHPLKSFANPILSLSAFQGTFCAVEGDEKATTVLENMFQTMGATTFRLDTQQKYLYHAGCVFASNYLVTLAEQAFNSFKMAGIEEAIAKASLVKLMQGTIHNIGQSPAINEALTGPIQRGDELTLKAHLDALSPEQRTLYSILGLSTLPLTTHDQAQLTRLKDILTTPSTA